MFFNTKKIFILLLILGIIFPIFSFAVTSYQGKVAAPGDGLPQGTSIKDVGGIVGILTDVLAWTYTILFIVAVMFILFAAYTYLTAGEDPEKVKSATNQIKWAAVAITVALISVSANVIISNFIGGGSSGGGSIGSPYNQGYIPGSIVGPGGGATVPVQ